MMFNNFRCGIYITDTYLFQASTIGGLDREIFLAERDKISL